MPGDEPAAFSALPGPVRACLKAAGPGLRAAAKKADPALVRDLEKAIFNIYAYHKRQIQKSWEYSKRGVVLGQRILPIDSVGVYVPGGTAAYPTTVLMNIIPAKIAGVPRIVVASPPGTFQQHPIMAAALYELNATEIYLVGGAQAVAALAYGTATIPRVDKIVGPGNAYVTAAKREVFGQVDIDMIAGPSEILVIAEDDANPAYIAADLMSQAEHGYDSPVWLVTDSKELGEKVLKLMPEVIADLPSPEVAQVSWRDYGEVVLCADREEMAKVNDDYAAEHVQVIADDSLQFDDLAARHVAQETEHVAAAVLDQHLLRLSGQLPISLARLQHLDGHAHGAELG